MVGSHVRKQENKQVVPDYKTILVFLFHDVFYFKFLFLVFLVIRPVSSRADVRVVKDSDSTHPVSLSPQGATSLTR